MALWKTMIHPKCFSAEEWVAYIKAAQNSEAMKRFEKQWSPCEDCLVLWGTAQGAKCIPYEAKLLGQTALTLLHRKGRI